MQRFALPKVGYLSHYCSKFIYRVLNTCEKAVSDMKLRIVALSYLEECKRVTYITIIVIYNVVNKRYIPLILLLSYQATLGFPSEKKTITFASYCCSLIPHFFFFPQSLVQLWVGAVNEIGDYDIFSLVLMELLTGFKISKDCFSFVFFRMYLIFYMFIFSNLLKLQVSTDKTVDIKILSLI